MIEGIFPGCPNKSLTRNFAEVVNHPLPSRWLEERSEPNPFIRYPKAMAKNQGGLGRYLRQGRVNAPLVLRFPRCSSHISTNLLPAREPTPGQRSPLASPATNLCLQCPTQVQVSSRPKAQAVYTSWPHKHEEPRKKMRGCWWTVPYYEFCSRTPQQWLVDNHLTEFLHKTSDPFGRVF